MFWKMQPWVISLLWGHHSILTQTKMAVMSLSHVILWDYLSLCGPSLIKILLCGLWLHFQILATSHSIHCCPCCTPVWFPVWLVAVSPDWLLCCRCSSCCLAYRHKGWGSLHWCMGPDPSYFSDLIYPPCISFRSHCPPFRPCLEALALILGLCWECCVTDFLYLTSLTRMPPS